VSAPADSVDVLKLAAQRLLDLADEAQEDLDTDDYWKPYSPITAWRDGFVNGMGGVCSELVGLFTPAAARELAGVFRAWARMGALDPDLLNRVGGEQTVALARLFATPTA
jgi:hypothetical protein